MANTNFTTRLRGAVEDLATKPGLGLIRCISGSLYTPVYRDSKYVWAKVMDCDGLLVSRRPIHPGEGAADSSSTSFLVGAVIQSEDATSQTKPNPLGKASLSHIPNGVWIRTEDGDRRRIDRIQIVFVLPKGVAPQRQEKFQTAKRNVENAADMMPEAMTVEVPRGISRSDLSDRLEKELRPFLKGRGRPKGS